MLWKFSKYVHKLSTLITSGVLGGKGCHFPSSHFLPGFPKPSTHTSGSLVLTAPQQQKIRGNISICGCLAPLLLCEPLRHPSFFGPGLGALGGVPGSGGAPSKPHQLAGLGVSALPNSDNRGAPAAFIRPSHSSPRVLLTVVASSMSRLADQASKWGFACPS